MAKSDDLLPEDFLAYLLKQVPELAAEKVAHQWAIAQMVWDGGTVRHRRHIHFDGAMSYTHQELTERFGRGGFAKVNARLGLFEVSPNYSMSDGYTYGYWLTPKGQRLHDTYLRRHWRKATELMRLSGDELQTAHTLPQAIASTGTDGRPLSAESAKQWRVARELNRTPVNLDTLKSLRRWLEWRLDDIATGRVQPDMFMPLKQERVAQIHAYTVKVLRLATTNLAGVGHINQRYVMAPSGRLFGKNINLQNAPTVVKQAALAGLWEYDFSNCHFSIVSQMAAQFGYQCEAIAHYLKHKKATRQAIAMKAGITEEDAKGCLLAIMYGAKAGTRAEFNAIPEAIGEDAARRLYEVPEFKAIKDDIQQARAVILDNWPRTRNGRLINALGKAISVKEPAAIRFAHLVQGAEAKALNIAVGLYPHHIVLLQHDGFAAISRLDAKAIEDAVEAELGYRLVLEEEEIRVDAQAQFLKPPAARRRTRRGTGSKTITARKARAGAGFRGSYVS